MGLWSLGSVREEVHTLVPSIPTSISGTPIERIADRQRLYMEQYTGQTIGSVGIAEKYQTPLLFLTCADVLEAMELQGSDAASISIGEFSINKGSSSNLADAKEGYRRNGLDAMMNLGRKANFYQAL